MEPVPELTYPEVEPLLALIAELPEPLRREALTHVTWTEDRAASYERLAFLGDSMLGLAIADEVFRRHPRESSGRLSQVGNQTVSGISCAEVGRRLGVPRMMAEHEPLESPDRMTVAAMLAGGRPLPEATEALIGACFVQFGFDRTAPAVVSAFASRLELAAESTIDAKSALQERLARDGEKVAYRVTAEFGPPHRRSFEVVAEVAEQVVGKGSGRSKKAAEQVAAAEALQALGD